MHGWDAGARRADEAGAAAAASGARDAEALAHDLRGLMLIRRGEIAASVVEFDLAVDLLDAVPGPEQPALLLNRGTTHLIGHDLPRARADLTWSIRLAAEVADPTTEFKARHNLGYAEYLAGDLPRALDTMARADALDVPVSRSVGLLDRARILGEAGLLAEAERALAEATQLLTLERANHDRAEAELERAQLALLRGEWDVARAHSGRARRDFVRRGSPGWTARADLTRWQATLDTRAGAARVAREVAARDRLAAGDPGGPDAEPRPSSPADDRVTLLAAEAQLRLGRVDDAAVLLAAMSRRPGPRSLSDRLHEHLVRAGVARAADDVPGARRELRTGLGALTREQARHHSLDLRTAMAVHGGRLAELDLRLALETRSPGRVLDSLERWRAMSHRRVAVTPPGDPELADLLTRLRVVTEDLRNAPPGRVDEHDRRRQQQLQQSIREREWRLQGDGRSRREARLHELRPLLRESGTDVLCHFVLDGHLAAVSVGRGRCTVTALAPWSDVAALQARVRADLDALAGRLLPVPLRTAIATSLGRDLERLDALVLPPSVAAAERLVVVPSRTLATLPWGMLPRRRRRATTVALSLSSWAHGLADPTAPATRPSVVAVAGPGLPLAGEEVRAVAAAWGAVASTSTSVGAGDADAASLATALAEHDLVHIAAHGTHNHDNPLFSSIRLRGGPLFAYDVPQDAPIAGHVVLSACDLGLTTPRPGGEVLGLTAALLGLGSRCVVSSIARVDDTTAAATMQRYHARLAAGDEAASALAASVEDDLGHPAPFVSFGSTWRSP